MMFLRVVSRSLNGELSNQRLYLSSIRSMSLFSGGASNLYESVDDFDERMFGKSLGNSPSTKSFYHQLDELEKARSRDGFEPEGGGHGSQYMAGLDNYEKMDAVDDTLRNLSLSDGLEGKLKKAATDFDINPYEIGSEDYTYRPDMTFRTKDTYETKELDLTKPGIHKPAKRQGFEVTTKEVLEKADFRNVRFLANFITEAGIIIKRSQTKISAKAQRKVAREIKTARAFGLMPFTTMGEYPFVFNRSREELDEEEDFESIVPHRFVEPDPLADTDIVP